MPAYALRPARAGDAAAVAAIWRDGWRDGHLGHVPAALVAVRTPESFQVRAAQRIGDTVVATTAAGGAVAGFVMVVGDEVEQVYVSAGHRGSGVAALLLAEGERVVAAGGHRRAWLAVVPGNARARRFYERCGWSDAGLFDYQAMGAGASLPVSCHRYVKPVSAGLTDASSSAAPDADPPRSTVAMCPAAQDGSPSAGPARRRAVRKG